ncbi:DUF1566 domain-containing protein [Candidatus Parabeggiatoa sp. HSG14]|uniref:protein kinase domain-containing protein n=1 Tax=Candidatus Parabeggiatoa sp. HSG14 TaxID=3055593 RepID=UPI0025A91360|nr:DUF1566 domain-containing protein [Thiotrichales bacterium HSG14]
MSSPTLTRILFGSLLDSPAIVELASKAGEKAYTIIKEHFTYSAYQITNAYQEGYGYALSAISVGIAREKLALTQKIFNAKITREFAEKIESHYFQPFTESVSGVQSFSFVPADFRKQTVKSLKHFAKHKDKLFEIKEITEEDLSALINYRDSFAITDIVLAQMQQIEPVDESLAAFLRYEGLLGDAVLFFFRELIRKDDRLEKTQAALQREGLCIDVKNIQTTLDDLKSTQEKFPFMAEQIALQLQNLQQTETAWQTRHEQLIRFTRHFENQLGEMLSWAVTISTALDEMKADIGEIKEGVTEVKADVQQNQALLKKILQLLLIIERQGISAQVKPRDEFTQHNNASLQSIREAVKLLKQLPAQNPDYSRVVIRVGSALSSAGELAQAERLFQQVLEKTDNVDDKALAHFDLFQVQIRSKAYTKALKNLQAAIAINPQRYALHDVNKYPIERLLGVGGMGCVFLCQNRNRLIRQHYVVVKCFWENLKGSLDEVFKEPFAMRDIAGDYIPEPLDFGYVDVFRQERAYFITAYIDGAIDGEAWLEKYAPLDLETGLQVGLQIAKGLQIAHDAGIYHLDLKPANILLLKTSDISVSVKIIDFGLSQVATSLRQEATVQKSRSGLSTFGQAIFGTLDYASPEQQGFVHYGKPTARSDIFAFAATMYRLWTGKTPRPFRERDLPKVTALRDLLCDCIESDPTHRPESVQQLVNQLEDISEELSGVKQKKQAEIAKRKAEEERQVEIAKQKAEEEKRRQAEIAHKRLVFYRYIDNGNGTVTDYRTGLIWLKNANCFGRKNWETAMQLAAKLAHGQCGLSDGSKPGDWRLPTKEEWKAMIDTRYKNPVLSNAAGTDKWKEGDAFSSVQTNVYWSSTTVAHVTYSAWYVTLDDGYVNNGYKAGYCYVWPVRGGV